MPIKTPAFWYRPFESGAPLIEQILSPLSTLYHFGHRLNLARYTTRKVPIPVICVGNVTAGGSGKTPTTIALHKLIKENKIFQTPYFLSRGYGGTSKTHSRCIEDHDAAHDTGDEPLLLAKHSKTIISVNRYDGAKLAHDLGADCILMDDGFQNPGLYKDISCLVIDGETGFGNGKLLPAGPLREPPSDAFERADAIIMIGKDKRNIQKSIPTFLPVFHAHIKPSSLDSIDISSPYIAFCGLGRPEKFRDTLIGHNMNIIDFHSFSDHHSYTSKDIEKLIEKAKKKNARLITTEKDYQRIPEQCRQHVTYLSIELVWENEEAILAFFKNAFSPDKTE